MSSGGIPLEANYVNTQQPGPLEQYGKIMQLKSLMQGQQLQQQQLSNEQQMQPLRVQQAQQQVQQGGIQTQKDQNALNSQNAMIKAWSDPGFSKEITGGGTQGAQPNGPGFDPNAMTTGLIKRGVLPQDAVAMTNQFVDRSAKVSETVKNNAAAASDQIGSYQKSLGVVTDKLSSILDMPVSKAGPAFDAFKQSLAQNPIPGMSPQEVSALQNSTLDHLPAFVNMADVEGKIAAYHKQEADAQKSQAEAPGGSMVPPEVAAQQAWLAKNPGKDASDYQIMMKKLIPAYNFNLQGGTGGGLNDAALDQAAQRYAQTGVLPAMGMGTAGAAARKAIMNRAGELSPTGSIAANSAEYAANENSLKNLQKNFDQVTAFENTAGKNLDQFLSTAKSVVDSNSPLVNTPLRLAAGKVAGSPQQAAFDAARTTALTEISKVLNSSNASGVLSDSARNEVSQLIGKDATLKQIYSAANILKTDMGNRHDAYQDQIGDIQKRLGGNASPGGTAKDLGAAPSGASEGQTGKFNGVAAKIVNGRIVAQ